jgi:hypothetical protein
MNNLCKSLISELIWELEKAYEFIIDKKNYADEFTTNRRLIDKAHEWTQENEPTFDNLILELSCELAENALQDEVKRMDSPPDIYLIAKESGTYKRAVTDDEATDTDIVGFTEVGQDMFDRWQEYFEDEIRKVFKYERP